MNEKKYQSIMLKSELKELMDQTIMNIGIKLSYSQLIRFLIDKYENKK